MNKTDAGHFFEDFILGARIEHATPRTISDGDRSLYLALTGSRFALQSSVQVARRNGLADRPIDDLLVFHIVFGKSVPDISKNAVANLGYAHGHFHDLVYPGETLCAFSEVIGVKENSSGKSGIVYVRTVGSKYDGSKVLEFVRWVMVRKRDPRAKPAVDAVPRLEPAVMAEQLTRPRSLGRLVVDPGETGSRFAFEDYQVGERIDHVDGTGVMESEHRLATRLYQNTARVHFDDHAERTGRLGKTIVYGGVVISAARTLSFNGLGNAFHILAINAGTHANPCIPGDTIYAWSEVLDRTELDDNAGALRLRTIATKDRPCSDFPRFDGNGKYLGSVLLDFDYWVLMPKRAAFI